MKFNMNKQPILTIEGKMEDKIVVIGFYCHSKLTKILQITKKLFYYS